MCRLSKLLLEHPSGSFVGAVSHSAGRNHISLVKNDCVSAGSCGVLVPSGFGRSTSDTYKGSNCSHDSLLSVIQYLYAFWTQCQGNYSVAHLVYKKRLENN